MNWQLFQRLARTSLGQGRCSVRQALNQRTHKHLQEAQLSVLSGAVQRRRVDSHQSHIRTRDDGCGAPGIRQITHFAKTVTRLQLVHGTTVFLDADNAGEDDVEGIILLALNDNGGSSRVLMPVAGANEFPDIAVLKAFEEGDLELHKELNARVHMDAYEKLDNKERQELNNKLKKEGFINEKLLHFAGKFKPWSLKGILNKQSKPYHDYFEDIFDGEIHLQYNWKGNALKDLIYSIFSLYIFFMRFLMIF